MAPQGVRGARGKKGSPRRAAHYPLGGFVSLASREAPFRRRHVRRPVFPSRSPVRRFRRPGAPVSRGPRLRPATSQPSRLPPNSEPRPRQASVAGALSAWGLGLLPLGVAPSWASRLRPLRRFRSGSLRLLHFRWRMNTLTPQVGKRNTFLDRAARNGPKRASSTPKRAKIDGNGTPAHQLCTPVGLRSTPVAVPNTSVEVADTPVEAPKDSHQPPEYTPAGPRSA